MSTVTNPVLPKLPDHKDLPFKEDKVVSNFQEHPVSLLLTDSILPFLEKTAPNGLFTIGQDSFIYYRLPGSTVNECKAPDWFCVLGVPRLLDGGLRNSYVMWQENITPAIVLEVVSGDGTEEHDRTPRTGKFWAYEQGIHVPYYGIYDQDREYLEVYSLVAGRYQQMTPNAHGRHGIVTLGLELGLWRGSYFGADTLWPRWWHPQGGALLLTGREEARALDQQVSVEQRRAELEHTRAEAEKQRAEAEKQRAETERLANEKLKEKLRSLGIDPDTI